MLISGSLLANDVYWLLLPFYSTRIRFQTNNEFTKKQKKDPNIHVPFSHRLINHDGKKAVAECGATSNGKLWF